MRKNRNGVPKVETLGLLDGAGAVSTADYAAILSKGGFPGTYYRAHRLLVRFHAQGLVTRTEDQKMVRYDLKNHLGEKGPVERRQRVVLWEITKKGLERLKWLRNHDSGARRGSREKRTKK